MADTTQYVGEADNPRGPRGSSGGKRVLRLPWEELDAVTGRCMRHPTGCATRSATAIPLSTNSPARRRNPGAGPHNTEQRPQSGNA